MKVVVISRGRHTRLKTLEWYKSAVVVCPESELNDYKKVCNAVAIPDDCVGISKTRNAVMRMFNKKEDDCVLMLDDDLLSIRTFMNVVFKLNEAECNVLFENLQDCAENAGARLFGLNNRFDPRVVRRNAPFAVHQWLGNVIGVIGTEVKWDENLKFKCDCDCVLRELLHRRIIWQDARYSFECDRDKAYGGNSKWRSQGEIEKEKAYLKQKWGCWIEFGKYKSQEKVNLCVVRNQKIDLQ